jgi:segregation and condensation protein B
MELSRFDLALALVDLDRAVEAMVFAADEVLTAARMAAVIAGVVGHPVREEQVREAVARLNTGYGLEKRAFRIQEWAGGYRMATVPEVAPYLRALQQFSRQQRLSRSLLETLAVLAYKQPVTRPEVEFVRGVDTGYALQKLMEMGLADVTGRATSVGRPLLYGTTPRFLEVFGLRSLEDLPNLREVESLLHDPAFNREKARLLMQAGLVEAPADAQPGTG